MMERTVYLTDYDYQRLGLLLEIMNSVPQNRRDDLSCLEDLLVTCHIVTHDEMPENIVTINSRVKYFDLDTSQEKIATLVFPINTDLSSGRIAVTSPIGAAILGYAEGDVVAWKVSSGRRSIRIDKVLYQPEATGENQM
jgi:regulator of nucleoside diphosphate kinase